MKKNAGFLRFENTFRNYYRELAAVSGLEQMADYPQHGSTTRLLHCVAVAYYSCRLARAVRLPVHRKELIRGALLHDYFFYDAQDGDPAHTGHWNRHPDIALENAGREIELSGIEREIIQKHMFPLTPKPPRCLEAVLVSLTDKACAVYEFFKRRKPYGYLRGNVMKGTQALVPAVPETRLLSSDCGDFS